MSLQHPWQSAAGRRAGDRYWNSLAEIQARMEATGQSFTTKAADGRSIIDWIFQR